MLYIEICNESGSSVKWYEGDVPDGIEPIVMTGGRIYGFFCGPGDVSFIWGDYDSNRFPPLLRIKGLGNAQLMGGDGSDEPMTLAMSSDTLATGVLVKIYAEGWFGTDKPVWAVRGD